MNRNDYEHSRPLDEIRWSEIKVKAGTKCFTVCFTLYNLPLNNVKISMCYKNNWCALSDVMFIYSAPIATEL